MSLDDAAIVALAVLDLQAFAPLYATYLCPVHRYCYFRLGSREAAEDATSRVFEKVLSSLHGFRGGSFRAWLFTIAHHVVVDDIRSFRPVQPLTAAASLRDPQPGPEEWVLNDESWRTVDKQLVILSADQRHVVELRLSGLNGREIASVLGRSHAWVRTTQMRALSRMRTAATALPEAKGWPDVD